METPPFMGQLTEAFESAQTSPESAEGRALRVYFTSGQPGHQEKLQTLALGPGPAEPPVGMAGGAFTHRGAGRTEGCPVAHWVVRLHVLRFLRLPGSRASTHTKGGCPSCGQERHQKRECPQQTAGCLRDHALRTREGHWRMSALGSKGNLRPLTQTWSNA